MNGFDEWWESQGGDQRIRIELDCDDFSIVATKEMFQECFAAGVNRGLSMLDPEEDSDDFDADETNRICAERLAAGLPIIMTTCVVANIITVAK